VIQTKKDIEGYFKQLSFLLNDRREQLLLEADQRLQGVDDQLLDVNGRMAQIQVSTPFFSNDHGLTRIFPPR